MTFKIISGGLELTTTYDDSNDLELDNEVVIDYFLSALDPDQIYNLDLTFDDPVTTDGSNMLLKDMFLINTLKLESINDKEHNFDYNMYFEAK